MATAPTTTHTTTTNHRALTTALAKVRMSVESELPTGIAILD